ncbi:MAG: c-type cytochrome, partial [Gemmatimonadota bacterium]
SGGTIPQLTESFVFWRIAKGGPGLPVEGTPWNSAMPAWEDILTEDEIWAVTIFLYEQTGATPRTWEEAGEEGGEH